MPEPTSRRKALLIGVRAVPGVIESVHDAVGAHKDTKRFRNLLGARGYNRNDIIVMKDDSEMSREDQKRLWPTRENVLREMKLLIKGAGPKDHFVFMYAGHGDQVPVEKDQNEIDGLDEVLMASDSKYAADSTPQKRSYVNAIKDDEIREIFSSLPASASCVMVFDCCHSGTAADLPDMTAAPPPKPLGYTKLKTVRPGSGAAAAAEEFASSSPSKHHEPNLTSWSACEDAQITVGTQRGGVFLQAFCQALTNRKEWNHYDLLHGLPVEIDKIMDQSPQQKAELKHGKPVPQLGSLWNRDILAMPVTL